MRATTTNQNPIQDKIDRRLNQRRAYSYRVQTHFTFPYYNPKLTSYGCEILSLMLRNTMQFRRKGTELCFTREFVNLTEKRYITSASHRIICGYLNLREYMMWVGSSYKRPLARSGHRRVDRFKRNMIGVWSVCI